MPRKVTKSIEEQCEEISETLVKQIAMLHLPNQYKDLEPNDVEAVAELATLPIQELLFGILNATACGYLGSVDDKEDKEASDDDETSKPAEKPSKRKRAA